MEKTGTTRKHSLEQQRKSAELELIIEGFGSAMRNAHRPYVTEPAACEHSSGINFTPAMQHAWWRYWFFCKENPNG